jgi:hypothetical protein
MRRLLSGYAGGFNRRRHQCEKEPSHGTLSVKVSFKL